MREEFRRAWPIPDDLPPVGHVTEKVAPGPAGDIPVRVYTPEGPGPFPALVWYHGGGWTIGSIDENEYACRTICAGAGAVVVSADYRLAPENPFPAAADDCYAVFRWVHDSAGDIGVDPARIAVGGESAGGNLAAVTALRARDQDGPAIALQLLISPVLGHPDDGRASYRDFADGYFLTKSSMDWFFTTYPKAPSDLDDPYLLPLRATDLSGLPPALVLGAEYDVLRDEGEDYARALREAGGQAEAVRMPGLIHGFFGLLSTELSPAADAHARAIEALRSAFARSV
ncbi:alpha/beta hydrolase [Spongiactinospora rosea]|nr:alpha/beta hydrolase [Spongiactinospora rosea]